MDYIHGYDPLWKNIRDIDLMSSYKRILNLMHFGGFDLILLSILIISDIISNYLEIYFCIY
jgi:hypothetical protein